jgi:sugar (pentulose or hexulose) kinase
VAIEVANQTCLICGATSATRNSSPDMSTYNNCCPVPLQFCFVTGVNTGGFFVVWLLFSSGADMLSTISDSSTAQAVAVHARS